MERLKITEQTVGRNKRYSFSKTRSAVDLPNLVEIQTKSYQWFLDKGLNEVLRDVSPITDISNNLVIEFLGYSIGHGPKYSIDECKERDENYTMTLNMMVRLTNMTTGDIQHDEVVMCEFPKMTETGTFVVNGAERVIVSQIIRSPGMYYESAIDNRTGQRTYTATVIPYRGAWLEYELDANNVLWVKIDKTRKVPATVLVRALGVPGKEDIKDLLGGEAILDATFARDESDANSMSTGGQLSVTDAALIEIYRKLRPGEIASPEAAQTLLNNNFFDARRYDIAAVGRYKFNKKMAIGSRLAGCKLSRDVISVLSGEVLFEAGHILSAKDAELIEQNGVYEAEVESESGKPVKVLSNHTLEPVYVFGFDFSEIGLTEKMCLTPMLDIRDACADISDPEEYRAAVLKMARERAADLSPKHITIDDIFASINYMLGLPYGIGNIDNIDHLGNRRIRSVGEQLQNQVRIGFVRMDKMIKERMTTSDSEAVTIRSLVNTRPINAAIKEFFGSSQLSQFMDQNNPLAELTHKRRLSALGPGGLTRDRASFDVRDVHYTHYGRMCPIETPEGPNIGLISYLTTYARISDYGFIEAPYRKVDKETGIVTDEVVYMTADKEDAFIIAQGNEPLDENGRFVNAKVTARDRDQFVEVPAGRVDYMDVSPKMVVSVAAAMIPFLENDDNSRALMGANMQKQAVPLMITESPIVGTGMEYKAAVDSGVVVCSDVDGIVDRVEADKIVIELEDGHKKVFEMRKFKRTNQGTCFNQRPIVRRGDRVKVGDVIADGPATCDGEISLGKNALIGFMTWEGYNYEDAVLLNERMVREDIYTSLHIEEYTLEARDTKLGPESITREIPNTSEDVLKDLNGEGIVKKGTEVRAGDILVGKVTPKGETEQTPEERLLHAIFGDKSKDVRDTSLKMPHGESGVVVDTRVYTRENDHLSTGVVKKVCVYIAQKRKISVGDKMAGRHGNKGVVSRILPPEDMPFLPDGTPLDIVLNPLGVPSRMNIGQVLEVHLGIAAKKLGWKIMTPVFDGANERDIKECMKAAGMYRDIFPLENPEGKELYEKVVNEETGEVTYRQLTDEEAADKAYTENLRLKKCLKLVDGKTVLYDGRTGEPFDNPVTVGIMYYLKLHHLVDDKIHARSNGPYSLVTQQPLGGKAQFGGQRFGEMEVWALEAYGAAYTLQEILTIKSDDINGRRKTYEAIIKGQNIMKPGVPESFKVLVRELQALALDVRILDQNGNEMSLAQLSNEEEFPKHDNTFVPSEGQQLDDEDLYGGLMDDQLSDADPSELENNGYSVLDENGQFEEEVYQEEDNQDEEEF
ncbi:MAG: DNA-directed RNA polymerase subunit beta [Clostridia bacterium]|nr:DNA-directed RNA polymerase subunit beta [Clostridia bacterium]